LHVHACVTLPDQEATERRVQTEHDS